MATQHQPHMFQTKSKVCTVPQVSRSAAPLRRISRHGRSVNLMREGTVISEDLGLTRLVLFAVCICMPSLICRSASRGVGTVPLIYWCIPISRNTSSKTRMYPCHGDREFYLLCVSFVAIKSLGMELSEPIAINALALLMHNP